MPSVIKIIGINQLKSRLKQNVTLEDVKKIVDKNGRDLQSAMVKNTTVATFNKGYSQGDIMRDVSSQGFRIEDNGLSAIVGTTKEYGPYLEHGTRFMAKEQFAKPSLDEVKPKFKADMQHLVK